MNLNKVFVLGRVTRDPELKVTPNSQQVVSFSIATNKKWKDKNGDMQEMVEFHNIVFWGKSAETIAQYVKKGSLLLVEGRLQTRDWEDKDSKKKMYRTEIIGENFQLPPKSMSGGGEDSGAGYQRPAYQKPRTEADEEFDNFGKEAPKGKKKGSSKKVASVEYPDEGINPDDIPF
jgi:single-strand DNA-binding protein